MAGGGVTGGSGTAGKKRFDKNDGFCKVLCCSPWCCYCCLSQEDRYNCAFYFWKRKQRKQLNKKAVRAETNQRVAAKIHGERTRLLTEQPR